MSGTVTRGGEGGWQEGAVAAGKAGQVREPRVRAAGSGRPGTPIGQHTLA